MFIFEPPAGLEPASDDPYSPILPLNYGGLLAQAVGIEPTHEDFGDPTGTLPVTCVFLRLVQESNPN